MLDGRLEGGRVEGGSHPPGCSGRGAGLLTAPRRPPQQVKPSGGAVLSASLHRGKAIPTQAEARRRLAQWLDGDRHGLETLAVHLPPVAGHGYL